VLLVSSPATAGNSDEVNAGGTKCHVAWGTNLKRVFVLTTCRANKPKALSAGTTVELGLA